MQIFFLALVLVLLATSSFAHPGESLEPDVHRRLHHLEHPARRGVFECTNELEKRGWISHQADRRHARLNELREQVGYSPLARRDRSLDAEIFGRQAGCVLDPEVTEGPYWVGGELIREDIRSGRGGKVEPGIVLYLDINVIDVSNCQPVPDAFVELWGCNSTGVYTGVVAPGNGDGNPSEIYNNALRGIQPTAKNGTASFISLVPGHYTGRANHLHIIIHHGATRLKNNTISGGTISHVGQLYFDQSVLKTVEDTAPYTANRQRWTQNDGDGLFRLGFRGGDNPIIESQMVGRSIKDGLWGTIDVGVNPLAVRNPRNVSLFPADSEVRTSGSMWGTNPTSSAAPPRPSSGGGPGKTLRGGGLIGGAVRSVRSIFQHLQN
ncbi:extracellular dioxygenase [Histoplasma ohiense]|nr:extracellular dioxygenase [Histoplasma ohiense (nom. inval.)]